MIGHIVFGFILTVLLGGGVVTLVSIIRSRRSGQ